MRTVIALVIMAFSSLSFSQDSISPDKKIGAEIGGLYLFQDNDGNTMTALPMLNYKFMRSDKFELRAQVGFTAYLEDETDDTFFVGVARVNPIYHISETTFSLEGLVGLQYWDKGSSFGLDLGGRLNYDIADLFKSYLDEVFVGGGFVSSDEPTTYITAGIKKWF